MKVLVITHLFHPDRGGGAAVFSDLCFELADKGHSVDVVTTYPYYPEWKNKSGANALRITEEHVRGVKVRRYGIFVPRRPSSLWQRVAYELSFVISTLRSLSSRRRYDVVVVYCPLLGSVMFAVLRVMLTGEKLWINIQDIPADAAACSGISKSTAFNRAASWVQCALFRRGDVVSTIAPLMVKRVAAIMGGDREVVLFPNWLHASMAEVIDAMRSNVSRPRGPMQLTYAGNLGKKQGLVEFCEALGGNTCAFIFNIYGDGSEAQAVRTWVDQRGDERFQKGPFLDENGFVHALLSADFFIITEKVGVGASFIPSKLIPSLASGTPVIAVCDEHSPLGSEVREYDLGPVIPWANLEGINELLEPTFRESERYRRWAENCRRRAEAYGRSRAMEVFERLCAASSLRRAAETRPGTDDRSGLGYT